MNLTLWHVNRLDPRLVGSRLKFSKPLNVWLGSENSAGRQLPSLAKAVDVFALGCLFFYILTRGGHPFGSVDVRDSNILRGIVCLDGLECLEARDLIMKMLASAPSER